MNKLKTFVKDNLIIILMMIIAGVVYVYGMYNNKPWYDELYTYYFFVSRGPVYAAIHWPVPNNHIGYSVLAAFFDLIFDSYIGLRGVAVIASIANIALIYRIAYKLLSKKSYGYLAAVVFAGSYLGYSLAFQGRGYALITACFLTAINALLDIIFKKEETSHKKLKGTWPYIIFAMCLALGLYAIPSSLYWVVTVCLFGGFVLLLQKRYKEMRKLIYFSIAAAVVTFGLYSLVWLAIGSNLLSKDATSAWYNMYQVKVILKAPFASFKTGMDYMLATPYIQSTDRTTVVTGLWGYLGDLFNLYVGGIGKLITVLFVITAVFAGVGTYKNRSENDNKSPEFVVGILLLVHIIVMPAMLIIQSVQPYKRVFSYFSAIWAFALVYLVKRLVEAIKNKKVSNGIFAVLFACISLGVIIQTYRCDVPLAGRENDIADVLNLSEGVNGFSADKIDSIYYTDDLQKFVIKFYYDVEPVETTLEEAQYVLVSRDLLGPGGERDWPMLTYYEDFKYDYVVQNFELLGKTDAYELYRRKADF